jgi:hypothetical protein
MGEKATATAIENNHNPPAEAMAALATAIENNHNRLGRLLMMR